jgi:hypothetical protein
LGIGLLFLGLTAWSYDAWLWVSSSDLAFWSFITLILAVSAAVTLVIVDKRFDWLDWTGMQPKRLLSTQNRDHNRRGRVVRMFETLNIYLSKDDLQTICFYLSDVEYDNLPAQTKKGRIRELVELMDRRRRLSELRELIFQLRPDIPLN